MFLPWWSRRRWMSIEYKLLLFGLRDMRSNDFPVSPPRCGVALSFSSLVNAWLWPLMLHRWKLVMDLEVGLIGQPRLRPQSPVSLINLPLFMYSSRYPSQRDHLPQLLLMVSPTSLCGMTQDLILFLCSQPTAQEDKAECEPHWFVPGQSIKTFLYWNLCTLSVKQKCSTRVLIQFVLLQNLETCRSVKSFTKRLFAK